MSRSGTRWRLCRALGAEQAARAVSRAPDDPDAVVRIAAELADVPRGPIDEDREPPLLPMDGDDDGNR